MENSFQKISDYLQPVLPEGWSRVCLYAEITETYSEIVYYCFINEQNKPIQCYNLTSKYKISEADIDNAITNITFEIENERKNALHKWSVMTYILFADAKFEVSYDYSNLTDGSYEFKKNWKKKYL